MFIHITLSARNAYGIPSSLFDKVLISDAFLTSISAFSIAIPIPAALSIGISFSESPKAMLPKLGRIYFSGHLSMSRQYPVRLFEHPSKIPLETTFDLFNKVYLPLTLG